MFDVNEILALRDARPFTPFRFHLCDGRIVDVLGHEMTVLSATSSQSRGEVQQAFLGGPDFRLGQPGT